MWHCFKASCDAAGNHAMDMTGDDLRAAFRAKEDVSRTFTLPEHLTNIRGNTAAFEWATRMHCGYALSHELADLRYDPKQNRAVFVIYDRDQQPVGALGRALTKGVKPKWYSYGDTSQPFVCGTSDVAVVVEDCASACAVAPVATGVAILGTNLQLSHVNRLKPYRKVILALDKDATRLAFKYHRRLSSMLPDVSVRMLEEDLKYLDADQVANVLGL